MPNIANETNVVRIVPQVKAAERNSSSWTRAIPCRPARRSQATKTASTATPPRMVASATGLPQPFAPALMQP